MSFTNKIRLLSLSISSLDGFLNKSYFYLCGKDFSVTLNAFFVVRWKDSRLVIDQDRIDEILGSDESLEPEWIPVDVSFIKEFWLPDAEILNLKEFKTLDVLSKLEAELQRKFFEGFGRVTLHTGSMLVLTAMLTP